MQHYDATDDDAMARRQVVDKELARAKALHEATKAKLEVNYKTLKDYKDAVEQKDALQKQMARLNSRFQTEETQLRKPESTLIAITGSPAQTSKETFEDATSVQEVQNVFDLYTKEEVAELPQTLRFSSARLPKTPLMDASSSSSDWKGLTPISF